MSLRALQREWYGKLRASGFVDLETSGEDGPLSDRGHPHAVDTSYGEAVSFVHRSQDNATYTEWAQSILHGARFPSREAREVWRLHAEGHSEADIATVLTVTRWRVRGHLAATRSRVSKVSEVKRWRDAKRQRLSQLRSHVRKADPETLTTLAALMLRQLEPGSP